MNKNLKITLFFLLLFKTIFSTENFDKFNISERYSMQDLIENISLYKTTNKNFHAGDLLDHSIWVTKVIEKWFDQKDNWTFDLDSQDKKIALYSAFLHDIGKAGDLVTLYYSKPGHAEVGFEYLLGKKTFKFDSMTTFNFDKFFENLKITEQERKFIAIIVGMHHEFGERVLKNCFNKQVFLDSIKYFKQKIVNYSKIADYNLSNKDLKRISRLSILLSAADVKGCKPVEYKSNFFNKYSYKNLLLPEVNTGSFEPYDFYQYDTLGRQVKEELLYNWDLI